MKELFWLTNNQLEKYHEILIQNDITNLDKKESAFEYYIKSASIWMSEYGIDYEDVQEAIVNAKRLAKELNKENELLKWMK